MTDDPPPRPGPSAPWPLELDPDEARARFREARARGHPEYLWPAVDPEAHAAGLARLEETARAVLLGRPAALEPGGVAELRALGVAAYTAGLGPLLGLWIEEGRLRAAPGAADLFALHLRHGRRRADRLAAILEEACAAVAGSGEAPLVVKSAHTAHAFFPEPGVRPAVDVDLVVSPDAFGSAEEALARAGYERVTAQARPRKSEWLAPGSARLPRSLELLHAESQYAVDLHASLARNFHGVRRVDPGPPGQLATEPAGFVDADARVLAPAPALGYHLLHASERLAQITLVRLVEVVYVARAAGAGSEALWSEVRALLEACDGLGFAWPALALAEGLVPGTVPSRLVADARGAAPALMRGVVEGLTPAGAQRFHELSLRERFMWCETPVDVVRRLAHMALPAPAGRSLRRLAAVYSDRLRRLIRGRVVVERSGGRE